MYFPELHPDDCFRPDSTLENNLRRLLNSIPEQGDPADSSRTSSDITLPVRNDSTVSLNAGQPVQFLGTTISDPDIIPVSAFTSANLPWGVLTSHISPGEIGECLLHGCATVTLDSGTDHFAQPSGTTFSHATSGLPILAEFSDGTLSRAIVSTSATANPGGGTSSPAQYTGPFSVTISGTTVANISGGHVRRAEIEDNVPASACILSGTSCGIYLAARYNTSTYSVTYTFIAAPGISAIPCPSGFTQYAHCLARVSGGSVTQTQYGDILVTGVWL